MSHATVSEADLQWYAQNCPWVDWERERFMLVAYKQATYQATRAFRQWHRSKRQAALAECLAKLWDTWLRSTYRGIDPEPLLQGMIHFAILWVRYDRVLAGRSRRPDVFDYRAKMTQQLLTTDGQPFTSDRSSREQYFIDWHASCGDDPAELAANLEEHGITIDQWFDM